MARLERPAKAKSQDAGAYVPQSAFDTAGVDPTAHSKYCAVGDGEIRVKVSPAALEYLATLPSSEQDRRTIQAIRFATANARPRLWATDFALAQGCSTQDEVAAWYATNGIRTRSKDYGSLRRP